MSDCVAPVALSRAQLDELELQIAELSQCIDVAKHQLLTHLREFDTHEGWAGPAPGR